MTQASGPFAHVHALVRRIPRGRVATYGQLSQMIGRRLSAVAIGWALRAAPKGLPWHRVINASGGVSTKDGRQRMLLEAEGVYFGRDGRVNLERFQWRPRRGQRVRSSAAISRDSRTRAARTR